ncbi:MAG TPA: peptidoglycan-binding protein [Solirubrobacteraceae bacterium]|nr:peptidoglycan-binding protein [Solirubrobacteraceae bacterium]
MSRRRTLVVALWLLAACLLPATEATAAKRTFGVRALQEGSVGRDVRVLQDFLTRWGLRTHVDGHYGPVTARRVRRWETLTGRPVDGRMSLEDAAELRRAVEAGERRPDVAPAAGGTPAEVVDPAAAAAAATTATAPVEHATMAPDGTAIAPPSAPEVVKALIAAANEIHDKPYKYGGGHGRWIDSGYDCSGSMSYALHGAGLLDVALDSTGFMSWGEPGEGQWVTNYANPGHSYMVIAGLRFDTSGRAEDNTRWDEEMRDPSGYTVRHPPGL